MPEVIVRRPLREFELPDEDRLHPATVLHLRRRQSYNDADGGTFAHDWSIPGVNFGTAIWSGPTVVGFLVIFELPTGVIIDDAQVTIGNGADCLGSSIGGTTFCAGPYSAPWAVTMVGRNDILFHSSGDLLTNGDSFFVDIFFTGGTRMARPSAESLFPYPSPRVESWLARESSHS